jgi:6-phosphofructokinase 2
MGDRLLALLAGEDVPALPVAVSGETHQSFAVTDQSTGAQYRLCVPGQVMHAQDADALLAAIAANTTQDSYLVLSGGVAPGLPADFQSQITADSVNFAAELGARGVAKTVVTGRGAQGSVLVSKDHRFLCHAPKVKVRSKFGAGDAFVGAMTLALARGEAPNQALNWGEQRRVRRSAPKAQRLAKAMHSKSVLRCVALTLLPVAIEVAHQIGAAPAPSW